MTSSKTPQKTDVEQVAEGLLIFAKYRDVDVGAEQDIILCGPDISQVSYEDRERLDALGWFISEEFECWARFV